MENKLDIIINTLNNMKERLDAIEMKIATNCGKLIEIESKLNLRCDDIEDRLNNKVDLNSIEALKINLNHVEDSIELKSKKLEAVTGQILQLEDHLRKFKAETEQDLLAKELYDKRLNILIYGIEENIKTAWETRTETEKKIREFLNQALKIPSSHAIAISDAHRLPQHIITKQGKRITRPIIVKLSSYNDKKLIMTSLKNLKQYNEERKSRIYPECNSVYVTEHLPRALIQQKKTLLPAFKNAKNLGKKVSWKIEQLNYCLYIDNAKYSI